jgi:hypothetical protein
MAITSRIVLRIKTSSSLPAKDEPHYTETGTDSILASSHFPFKLPAPQGPSRSRASPFRSQPCLHFKPTPPACFKPIQPLTSYLLSMNGTPLHTPAGSSPRNISLPGAAPETRPFRPDLSFGEGQRDQVPLARRCSSAAGFHLVVMLQISVGNPH